MLFRLLQLGLESAQIPGRNRPLPNPLSQVGREAELLAPVAELEHHEQDLLHAILDSGC